MTLRFSAGAIGTSQRLEPQNPLKSPVDLEFDGDIWTWRGPAPYFFVTVPAQQCEDLKAISGFVTYGWGMVPATVQIGNTRWKTSLWPKDGGYVVPLKDKVRKAEGLNEGDTIRVRLEV